MSRPENESGHGEILVVDDTTASLAFLSELLSKEGYSVRVAPNGDLALWTVEARIPDLILLDVRMPGMDGFEVCRRLKASPLTHAVPVIFLSAQSEVADKVRGFQVGGVDYIGKPFASEEVLQRVATHVSLARVTRELEAERLHLEANVARRTAELLTTTQELQAEVVARKAAETRLRLLASAFEVSLSAAIITEPDGRILAVNPAFTALFGYAEAAVVGQTPKILKSDRHPVDFFAAMWRSIKSVGRWQGELWNKSQNGNVFPCLHNIVAVRNEQGETTHFVGVYHDLSESRDAQTLIDFLTKYDHITGLPNRLLVQDRFDQIVSSLGESGECLALVCVTLDKFRFINEFHGHSVGDDVLRWASSRLLETIPSRDTLYRESGADFFLLHHDDSGAMGIRLLIEAIQSRLNADVPLEGQAIAVSISVGVALYPTDGNTLEELAGNAAIAMARARDVGGEVPAFFSENLDQGVRKRFELSQRLRTALAKNEFEVYYQPQIDALSGRLVSAEALLRWRPPEHGFVSPAQFIPVAEETGQIVSIGAWVLRTVCEQIARWHADGCGLIKVAVNLSAVQFMREDLAATVLAAIQETGVPPQALELEVTEGSIIGDVEHAIATMHAFKKMGIALSLDDFGTGYSSLSYLRRFPLDSLKIDQSFIRELLVEDDAQPIVMSIISLAHNLRMQVVGEGVESQAQYDFLKAHGCDLLQGYHFGKPMPAPDFLRFWQANRAAHGEEKNS